MNSDEILDTIPAHLLLLDDKGSVHEFHTTDRINGHPMPQNCGININTLFSHTISRRYLHTIKKLKIADSPISFDYAINQNGQQHHFRAHGSQQDSNYLFIIQTTSEDSHAKEETEKLYEQIRKAQKMEALGRLSSGIAHDFNNILASILGYADLTLDIVSSQGQQELVRYINEVINEGEKARDLITQMLVFARTSPNEDIALNPAPLVKELAKVIRTSLPNNIKLIINTEADLQKILIAPSQLQQVILNICNNSLESMAEKHGQITISLCNASCFDAKCSACHQHFDGDFVEISIADDGEGIDPDKLDQIFNAFYTSRDNTEQSGMGLVTVDEILHEHQGHILVESIVNYGTTTRLLFPAAKNPQQIKSEQTDKQLCSRASILIIEDEETIANLQSELLQSRGFSTATYSDAYEALSRLKATPGKFDCIVIDQLMPSLSGIEFSKLALQLRPKIPIILCLANRQPVDQHTLDLLGIRGQLQKPFTSEQLIEEICKLVQTEKEIGG